MNEQQHHRRCPRRTLVERAALARHQSVAIDPKRTQCLCATLVLRGVSVAGA